MIRAILFDLDETLILDEPVVRRAFLLTAQSVTYNRNAAEALALAAERHAKAYWQKLTVPALEYANRIGHSAFEGLWADYDPNISTEVLLEAAMRTFRVLVWEDALHECNLDGDATELAARWQILRARYPLYPDADDLLVALHGRYKLGIVTNGVAGLQRKKWHGCGLETWFEAVAISGEVGIGKPERGIFSWVAQQLEVELDECVMVGDNAERDVRGGNQAGMQTVWVDRGYKPRGARATFEVQQLLEILPWLESSA